MLFFYAETITVSPNGFDSRKFRLDFVELVPQAVDVDRHRRQFAQGIEMPYHFKEVLLGEDLIGMAGQEQEQVKFFADKGCGDSAITAHQRRFAGAVAPQYLNITTGGQH